ncbi:MAG: DUF481 domain-containing protein [Cyclobacteriaceae bacterium]|nr:DUF481 domain-containing protein [Cyclobacteriaceae bacterium]
MLGEIKDLDKGILIIETDYSDNDFEIEWKGVQKIFTESNFLVTTSDGNRYNGTLMSTEEGKIMIRDADAGNIAYASEEIVFLKSVDKKFWSRVNASIDVGWSVTKAQNFRQLTVRSNVGYMADRWSADANYNTLNSTQDDTDPIRRTDGGLAFRQYLPNDWYLPVDLTFLSNTEQKIDLRTNAKIGFGKYVIHTNSSYWGFAAGASYVNEVFTEAERNSWEGYFGTELNLYDIGDFSLLTRVVGYPGITESGRWRADFVLDTKYDLPLDFYIKLGYTLNYDNQPAEGAPDADYVFSTGLGWEL